MPGYGFYSEEYGGDLSEEAFAAALPAAARRVRWLVGAPDAALLGEADSLALRRACCAAAEAYAEWGDGQVGGFAIGSFRVTHYDNRGTTGAEQATAAALEELAGAGLAFAGAGR